MEWHAKKHFVSVLALDNLTQLEKPQTQNKTLSVFYAKQQLSEETARNHTVMHIINTVVTLIFTFRK